MARGKNAERLNAKNPVIAKQAKGDKATIIETRVDSAPRLHRRLKTATLARMKVKRYQGITRQSQTGAKPAATRTLIPRKRIYTRISSIVHQYNQTISRTAVDRVHLVVEAKLHSLLTLAQNSDCLNGRQRLQAKTVSLIAKVKDNALNPVIF